MRTENTRLKATSTILHQNPESRPEIIWLRALLHIRRIPRFFRQQSNHHFLSSIAQKCRWETPERCCLSGKISTLIDNSAPRWVWKWAKRICSLRFECLKHELVNFWTADCLKQPVMRSCSRQDREGAQAYSLPLLTAVTNERGQLPLQYYR